MLGFLVVARTGEFDAEQRALKFFDLRAKNVDQLTWDGPLVELTTVKVADYGSVLGPEAKEVGTLTEPRRTPYGLREFAYTDPDGNLLRIGSPFRV